MNYCDFVRKPRLMAGTLIGREWWFVVITVTPFGVGCVCDNANNVYGFSHEELLYDDTIIIDPEVAAGHGWGDVRDAMVELGVLDKFEHLLERDIPYNVMVEAQNGRHTHRFHYYEEKKT